MSSELNELRHCLREQAQGQVDGVEDEMHGHGREEGAGADVEPREGDAEEPERDERGGVDMDKREEEAGERHCQPDGHDSGEAAEDDAAEERLFEEGRFKEQEGVEKRLAAWRKRVGGDDFDEVLVGKVDVGETGEEFATGPVEAKGDEADGEGGEEDEFGATGETPVVPVFATGRMPVVPVFATGKMPVAPVAFLKERGDPEDEEEAAEEKRVVAEKGQKRFFVEFDVDSVEKLLPKRREAVGEDGINENRPRHKGVERSVF